MVGTRITAALAASFVLVSCAHRVRTAPPPVAAAPQANSDAVVYLLAAKRAERAGRKDDAVVLWEAATRADESSWWLQLSLARALVADGNDSVALEHAKLAVRLDSASVDAHRFLAEYYRRHDALDSSAVQLEDIVRYDPTDARATWRLISYYNATGRKDESARVLERLASYPGTPPSSLLEWARIADHVGMPASAESLYVACIRRWPHLEDGYEAYGGFLDAHSRPDDAESVYRQGIAAVPQSAELSEKLAWNLVGRRSWAEADSAMNDVPVTDETLREHLAWSSILLQHGQNAIAASHLERIIQAEPDQADAYVMLGEALVAQKKWNEAAVAFSQGASRDSSVQALTGLVFARIQAHDLEGAERAAREGVRAFPGDQRLLSMLGVALRAEEKWPESVTVFRKLVNADSTDVENLFYYASSLERAGRYRESEAAFHRLFRYDPHNAEAQNYLGYMYAERGEHLQQALHLVTQAVAEEPKNAAYLDSMGWVLYRLHRYAEAQRFLAQAISYDQSSATIYEHFGDVMEALGKRSQARAAWRQALSLDPGNAHLRAKLGSGSRE